MAKRKQQEARQLKRGGELQYEGFDRQLYCWIRQQRIKCAIHKALYYEFDSPVLHDKQYDFIEYRLTEVEARHTEISAAVTAEGYASPSSYVDSLQDLEVASRARRILDRWNIDGQKEWPVPFVTAAHADGVLYELARKEIEAYPI